MLYFKNLFILKKKKKGKWDGRGVYRYPSGNLAYEGGWKNGKKNGFGIKYFDAKNKVEYKGNYKDNLKHGKGVVFHSNGKIKFERIFFEIESN